MADKTYNFRVGKEVRETIRGDAGLPSGSSFNTPDGDLPPGLEFDGSLWLEGTPTEAGEWEVTFTGTDPYSDPFTFVALFVVGEPLGPPTVGEPFELDLAEETGQQYTNWTEADGLPPGLELSGAAIVGTPTEAGEWEVTLTGRDSYGDPTSATVTISILPASDPEPDPDPEDPGDGDDEDELPELPDLDPFVLYDTLARSLAPRVAAFVGRPGDEETTANAEAQIPVVTEYVRGYTRGRGFTDEAPAGPLRAVIVSGVARLATNPEQVTLFTTGDYTERPAQLAGWTLTELGVLRRYRRVTA